MTTLELSVSDAPDRGITFNCNWQNKLRLGLIKHIQHRLH